MCVCVCVLVWLCARCFRAITAAEPRVFISYFPPSVSALMGDFELDTDELDESDRQLQEQVGQLAS